MSYVLPISGVGGITGMTILAAIGEITRFPSAAKLVGYSGLGASVHASGQTFQTGRMTKQGRRELRTALIEIAWSAVRHDPVWKARFESLASKKGAIRLPIVRPIRRASSANCGAGVSLADSPPV